MSLQSQQSSVSTQTQGPLESLWYFYFPTVQLELEEAQSRIQIVEALTGFFQQMKDKFLDQQELENLGRAAIDFSSLYKDCPIAEFQTALEDDPENVLACLELAVHLAAQALGFDLSGHRRLWVRLQQYPHVKPLRNLKSHFVEHFVAIRGTVVRVGVIKPLVTGMIFECGVCRLKLFRHFPDGCFTPPTACEGKCKSRSFTPQRKSALTIDWQQIRVQEILSDKQRDQGRIPRTMECEFTRDLVDSCVPGDIVTLSGIVKARKSEQKSRGPGAQQKCLFLLYLDVNALDRAVTQDASYADGDDAVSSADTQFTNNELELVVNIAGTENLFKLLVQSLCPAIYGHEMVKAGLLLALFGGRQKFAGDRNKLSIRGDPHVLIVGDPGLGKSQMLRAVSRLAPRGVYVCGNTTTNSGLTVTLVREGRSGDYALEAGALVLADQGMCCIDEFDKISADQNALLEAMEQQSVSIAKAGICSSLAARCSVVAAANPVGGHYDRSKTVAENLKMSTPLLSRFDIIFILFDSPDARRDEMLSEHVIAIHSGRPVEPMTGSSRSKSEIRASKLAFGEVAGVTGCDKPLADRLQRTADNEKMDLIPHLLLRKYIAYARKYVKPWMSAEAKDIIGQFYLKLRKEHQSADSTPITTRQLESLVRLAEARAKVELRQKITAQDARDAVEVIKESMFDIFSDEFGHVDFNRSKGLSKSKQVTVFYKELNLRAQRRGSSIFTIQEMRDIGKNIGLGVENFEVFVEKMNDAAYLLNKGSGRYQVQSAAY
eukprot:gb/GEZN01001822.1/.p1 GENE.gb/GEZN01001822.1/~~gb/GEZN01001822.1/.p1  ORF type:complete len:773 (+),score=94.11 gb/GEZN01001822.1/:218-2536(+)